MIIVLSVAAVLLANGVASTCMAEITIQVIPSLAPNGWGSSNFPGYQDNAIYAIENGLSAYGDPASPTYYQVASSVLPISANIVTGFSSWLGVANPASPFDGELGNRLTFGLHILGNGTQFSISQLSFTGVSGDSNNTLGFSYNEGNDPNDPYDYGAGYVGINYGVDGIKGTPDDVIITSGPNTQLVDELVARGSGNAWDVYVTSPGTTSQDKIDRVANGMWLDTDTDTDYPLSPRPFDFTGTYTLNGVSGSGSVEFVPEPGTLTLLALGGLTALGAMWIRRR